MNYDFIGDIHGHHVELEKLLAKLGYQKSQDCWTPPPGTQAVFLGDFIDRGPSCRQVLKIVRPMIESGVALGVMGNHEYNAISYWTPDGNGGYLRPHSEKNRQQHTNFIEEFEDDHQARDEAIKFFFSLPLVLELADADLRVVHACWSDDFVNAFRANSNVHNDRINPEFIKASSRNNSPEHDIIEMLLKGPEARLAPGQFFTDNGNHRRESARVCWWAGAETRGQNRLILPRNPYPRSKEITACLTPNIVRSPGKTVVFGHYWWGKDISGPPVGTDWICVDLSVAKGGALGCYRWKEAEKEKENSEEYFVKAGAG
jgi:hypothetical protein